MPGSYELGVWCIQRLEKGPVLEVPRNQGHHLYTMTSKRKAGPGCSLKCSGNPPGNFRKGVYFVKILF